MPEIVQWSDIQQGFEHGLLLGNGASVAVHKGFSYSSLFEAATELGFITPPVQQVFDSFGEDDFEFVLRRLWQAKLVNDALGIEPGRVEDAYQEVRAALISAIREVHVSYEEALPHLEPICQFMQRFDTVVSLNYDLVVYWAAMHGNNKFGQWFKDCFVDGGFVEDWSDMRKPIWGAESSTLFFYPHGNLVLARRKREYESKIVTGDNANLLEAIFKRWEAGNNVPIFICEGTSEHKKGAIRCTEYLERVYREVMPVLGESLVVYGWSFSDNDDHILSKLRHSRSNVRRVAVSVFNNDLGFAQYAEDKLSGIGIKDVSFFDSASAGSWNNPSDNVQTGEE
ncbi:MAG: DUF4917 family protein [Proteobacteria bacterium]|nr:DUF4917 family protein [Pseudomonadota bacterium]